MREIHVAANLPFYEVHVATPLDVCEARDVKGLYKKARAGIIKGFTGIDSTYEEPIDADVTVGTTGETIADCVKKLTDFLEAKGVMPTKGTGGSPQKRIKAPVV